MKPFAARELLARVRANLELDRVRRTRQELERRQLLLDQAQRLAKVGSWEIDVNTSSVTGSTELLRQLQAEPEELFEQGFEFTIAQRVHPADRQLVRTAVEAAIQGQPINFEARLQTPDGESRTSRSSVSWSTTKPVGLPGCAGASRTSPSSSRRRRRSPVPRLRARPPTANTASPTSCRRACSHHRRSIRISGVVATYYRAGVEGTQVGGDWFDVIELGAGRTALVLGDVMGRGVRATAVMGQLRSAIRAYARLDLPPVDILEHLDAVVRDLGEDHIVTCIYAVYDPGERRLTYANAGHLPPLLRIPGEPTRVLDGPTEPPLGTGLPATRGAEVMLPPGSVLTLYTDGLVEDRDHDLDDGIARLSGSSTASSPSTSPSLTRWCAPCSRTATTTTSPS